MATRLRSDEVVDAGPPNRDDARWTQLHKPFLIALAIAAGLRLVVMIVFHPAFIFSDGPIYLSVVHVLVPLSDRPVGYVVLLLRPLLLIWDNVMLVAFVQHVIGLSIAVILYALLLRWGVSRKLALVATLPVLFDVMQLSLEHSILSDTLFEFLVVSGIALLCWRRRPSVPLALACGLLLGASVIVRQVGEPLIIAVVVYCFLITPRWKARVATSLAAIIAFSVPIGAYVDWYHSWNGVYAISGVGGKSLYMRVTSFVDCSKIEIPAYQRVLCPAEPPDQRLDPTYYGYHDPATIPVLDPPPGTTPDQAMREFAVTAIKAQPLDYARVVARDFMMNFDILRVDRARYYTAHKWGFWWFVNLPPTLVTLPPYLNNGGDYLHPLKPFAYVLGVYQFVVYTPGPVLFGCMVLGFMGALGFRRARGSGVRTLTALLTASATGLMLVPDITVEFVWRYQFTSIPLLTSAAVLAWTAIRRPDDSPVVPPVLGGQSRSRSESNSRSNRKNLSTNMTT